MSAAEAGPQVTGAQVFVVQNLERVRCARQRDDR